MYTLHMKTEPKAQHFIKLYKSCIEYIMIEMCHYLYPFTCVESEAFPLSSDVSDSDEEALLTVGETLKQQEGFSKCIPALMTNNRPPWVNIPL